MIKGVSPDVQEISITTGLHSKLLSKAKMSQDTQGHMMHRESL
jgi:hypothetical protein